MKHSAAGAQIGIVGRLERRVFVWEKSGERAVAEGETESGPTSRDQTEVTLYIPVGLRSDMA